MLNDRELATLIWLGVVIAFVAFRRKGGSATSDSVKEALRAFLNPRVLLAFVAFALWLLLGIWLMSMTGWWNTGLLKDTVIIFLTVGCPLLLAVVRAKDGGEILRKVRGEAISLSVIIAFYLNLQPLPLLAELVLVPVVFILVAGIALSRVRAELTKVAGCFTFVLLGIGLGLGAWTFLFLAQNWATLDLRELGLQLALSVWMPLIMYPYLYVFAFYAAAESSLVRLRALGSDLPLAAKLGVILGLRCSLRWARALTPRYAEVFREVRTFGQARRAMRSFRESVKERERADKQAVVNLQELAGNPGVDATGAQLDRREFLGTKRALEFVRIGQGNRARRNGERFEHNPSHAFLTPSRFGLPDDHGVVVEVSEDRTRWRAWRQLPSRYYLGIGGLSSSSQFLYEGSVRPTTWPGEGDEWVDDTRQERPPNWRKNDDPNRDP